MQITALAVFCGSKTGLNPKFIEEAAALGQLLAEKKITLIYGGGNRGIMAAVANAALEKEGKVIGIIPKVLLEWEAQHTGISELIIAEDMHSRKKMLYEKADAAIILPGGFGTLDEFFEMLTWNQLSIHDKRIFILNTDGFYDHLIAHHEKMWKEDFLYDVPANRIKVVNNVSELVPLI